MKNVARLMLGAAMVATSAAGEQPQTIDAFFSEGSPTRVIAHRGFSAKAPENTLAAVRLAMEIGADMVEIDITVSSDGHVVVIHDETLERTTNGRGAVAEHSLAELRELDAGSWFAPRYLGEPIPTLGEVLDLVRGRMLLNVEIKPEAVTLGAPRLVAELIMERRMAAHVVVSSFAPAALDALRREAPEIRTASLYNDELHRGLTPRDIVEEVGATAFNIDHRSLSRETLASCRELGLPVSVYTVNDLTRMKELVAIGVDAIFTDRPDALIELLEE
jgi:glycerophosphoryl diester phosphodiesterase